MVGIQEIRVRTRNRDSKTRQLIEAAVSVFSEHGYEKATTREISERAGCAEGLIYKYFGGKRDLLRAALAAEAGGNVNDGEIHPGATLEDEIRGLLQRRVDLSWEKRNMMRVCISLASTDQELADIMQGLERENVRTTTAHLRKLIDAGLVAPDADVETVATMIDAQMLSLGYFWRIIFGRDKETVDRQLASVARQMASSLAP